jgi:hypothetical protein
MKLGIKVNVSLFKNISIHTTPCGKATKPVYKTTLNRVLEEEIQLTNSTVIGEIDEDVIIGTTII